MLRGGNLLVGGKLISWGENMSLENILLIKDHVLVVETLKFISWGENMSLGNIPSITDHFYYQKLQYSIVGEKI